MNKADVQGSTDGTIGKTMLLMVMSMAPLALPMVQLVNQSCHW